MLLILCPICLSCIFILEKVELRRWSSDNDVLEAATLDAAAMTFYLLSFAHGSLAKVIPLYALSLYSS